MAMKMLPALVLAILAGWGGSLYAKQAEGKKGPSHVTLRWQEPCMMFYMPMDRPFETTITPLYCDTIHAKYPGLVHFMNDRGEKGGELKPDQIETRTIISRRDRLRHDLDKVYEHLKTSLLEATDPKKELSQAKQEDKPSVRMNRIKTFLAFKKRVSEEGLLIARQFPAEDRFKPFYERYQELEKSIQEMSAVLDASHRKEAEKMRTKFEASSTGASRMKTYGERLSKLPPSQQAGALGELFEGNARRPDAPGRASTPQALARAGSDRSREQLTHASVSSAERRYGASRDMAVPDPGAAPGSKPRQAIKWQGQEFQEGDAIVFNEGAFSHAAVGVVFRDADGNLRVARKDYYPDGNRLFKTNVPSLSPKDMRVYDDIESARVGNGAPKAKIVRMPARELSDGRTSGDAMLDFMVEDKREVHVWPNWCSTSVGDVLRSGGYKVPQLASVVPGSVATYSRLGEGHSVSPKETP